MENFKQKQNNLRVLNLSKDLLKPLIKFEFDQLTYKDRLEVEKSVLDSIDYMVNIYNNNGPTTFLHIMKTSRLMVLRSLAGCPFKQTGKLTGIKTDKNGFPCGLKEMKSKIGLDDPKKMRLTLTILFISRSMKFYGEADYSVIDKSETVPINDDFVRFLYSESNPYGHLPKSFRTDRVNPYVSTKAGPNGPALMSALKDLPALEPSYREKLFNFVKQVDRMSFLSDILHPSRQYDNIYNEKLSPRRLRSLDDKEGKVRIIAIPDYWTQATMKGLHAGLNKSLKELYCDCTFNQDHFKDALDPYFSGQTFYSIDLKLATELMPSNGQAEVLTWITSSKEIGSTWLELMTGYDWETDHHGNLRFKRGQPMGVYSSWPIMALTHHLIYRGALIRNGITELTEPYFLLGDDMLIIGERNFKAYQGGIKNAHMILNEDKTFASKDLFEFAKRFFYKGQEISPFPLGALLASESDASVMTVAIDNAIAKSGLCSLGRKSFERKSLFEEGVKVLQPSNKDPHGVGKKVEFQLHLTAINRGLQNPIDHAPLLDDVFLKVSCNGKKETIFHYWSSIFTFLLFDAANKHSQDTIQSCNDIMGSMAACDFSRHPQIRGAHPIFHLMIETQKRVSEFQEYRGMILENGDVGQVSRDKLMQICIAPIPTESVLYRANDKGSFRKQKLLGGMAKDIISICRNKVPPVIEYGLDLQLVRFSGSRSG